VFDFVSNNISSHKGNYSRKILVTKIRIVILIGTILVPKTVFSLCFEWVRILENKMWS
jgi:hypothetical protein